MTAPILARVARTLARWLQPISGRLLALLALTILHLLLLWAGVEVQGAGTQLWDLWIRLVENQLPIVRSTPT